jgi:ubiquitin-conjugating enzyme E2 J2
MWSVSTILTGLYSFMIETAPTLGSIETTTSQKRHFARESLEYNCRNPTFRKLFPEYADRYKKQCEERHAALGITGSDPVQSTVSSIDQNVMANGEADIQGFLTAAAGIIALLSALVFAMRFI